MTLRTMEISDRRGFTEFIRLPWMIYRDTRTGFHPWSWTYVADWTRAGIPFLNTDR